MRAVVQRVSAASVSVEGKTVSSIGEGLLVFLGVSAEDTICEAEKLAAKVAGLRVFRDENDKMNLSLSDIDGEILLISNFTLYGDVSHGFRPSFMRSAGADKAKPLYEAVLKLLSEKRPTKGGVFGGDMKVCAMNNGPVTVIVDTDDLRQKSERF